MNQPTLAVGSVFSGSGCNRQWLDLQMRALDRTTARYDHFVYLNQADENLFERSTIIGKNDEPRRPARGHRDGLLALSEAFRARRYERYLILDSDCFPVRQDWMALLDGALKHFGKRLAAPARVENLHWFAHPCAIYTADPGLLQFSEVESRNLLGATFVENQCVAPADSWLPLLRTNRRQRHPLLAAIYYDCFYHHGCGSRGFRMRPVTSEYYEHVLADYDDPAVLLAELMADPEGYIAALR